MNKQRANPASIHDLVNASKGRRKMLTGVWKGLVWPRGVSEVPKEIAVEFKFDAKEKTVTGEMSFTSWEKSRGVIENYLQGGFKSENDLTFTYAKKEDGVIGWGNLYLEMSPDGKKITGQVIGKSSHTGKHFNSELLLLKGKRANLRSFQIPRNPTIFIGHGGAKAWVEVKKHLERLGYQVETFESRPRAGKTATQVLEGMMAGSSFALLIMTGEDKRADGKLQARQNVIHEIGLFQGKLGIHRAIVLAEKGVEEFNNMSGIQYIGFEKNKISRAFKQIEATLKREFPD